MLPHELLSHVANSGFLPAMELEPYWRHVRQHTAWGQYFPGNEETIPCYLYGDDTRYNNMQKLTVVTLGFVLDGRQSSMQTHYPLFIVQEASHLHGMFWLCL